MNNMDGEELDFSKICRVCCLEGKVISIFKVHISRKLMSCTSIQVWRNDGLPSQICTKCVSKLHIAFQFKKLVEKSDGRLRQHLQIIKQNQQPSQEEQKQPLQQQQQQSQPTTEQSNACPNYVYVECTPAIDTVQNVQQFNGLLPPRTIDYNSLSTHQQLSNGYAIQSLHAVPIPTTTVHFQTYNVPIQMAQTPTNHLLTPLNQLSVTSIPLQQSTIIPSIIDPQQLVTQQPTTEMSQQLNDSVEIKQEKSQHIDAKPSSSNDKNCSTCGKEFISVVKLTRHMKIHSKCLPYRCKICHKGFSHNGNYKVHLRMHNDERPYRCTMCNRSCRQLQDLKKHIRTHTGEKPHLCVYCNKGFSTSSNLIAHMRIHTGEKPYVCSMCQKGFCQSNELTKHMRTHTGEKSHQCKLCHKGFNGSSTLVVHMRTHTGERPFVCSICQKGFTQSSCLQVHFKRHNNANQQNQPVAELPDHKQLLSSGKISVEECNS